MRLNIGCGPYPKAGWTNVDADLTVAADVHADALEFLDRLAAGEVTEIYAGHFLEHLEKPVADRFLLNASGCWSRAASVRLSCRICARC